MTRSIQVFQVDAFTQRLFTGNPAGVVLGAEVLTDDEMLAGHAAHDHRLTLSSITTMTNAQASQMTTTTSRAFTGTVRRLLDAVRSLASCAARSLRVR